MKRILLIGLSFVSTGTVLTAEPVVQGMVYSTKAFTSETSARDAKKPKSTFVRPVTRKKVLVASKKKKRVWVAFKLRDTRSRKPAGMTPGQLRADPQVAADLRQAERVQSVRNESIPDDSGAL